MGDGGKWQCPYNSRNWPTNLLLTPSLPPHSHPLTHTHTLLGSMLRSVLLATRCHVRSLTCITPPPQALINSRLIHWTRTPTILRAALHLQPTHLHHHHCHGTSGSLEALPHPTWHARSLSPSMLATRLFASSGKTGKSRVANDAKGTGIALADVEAIYQKKSPTEHILLRPDSYVGSIQQTVTDTWVLPTEHIASYIHGKQTSSQRATPTEVAHALENLKF
jgi:hypothetical protein